MPSFAIIFIMKIGSYIFLAVLIFILIFVVGFRLGQNVEQTNKTIDSIDKYISAHPTPTLAPTKSILGFKLYQNKDCGLQFLIPSSLAKEVSSTSATFSDGKSDVLKYDCRLASPFTPNKDKAVKIVFQKRNVEAEKQGQLTSFQVYNPIKGRYIYFSVDQSLYPLLDKTLEFTSL